MRQDRELAQRMAELESRIAAANSQSEDSPPLPPDGVLARDTGPTSHGLGLWSMTCDL